jgi:putative tricarboxylic transport membrane protein
VVSGQRPEAMKWEGSMKEPHKLHAGENLFSWVLLAFSIFVLVLAYRISGFSSISSPGMFPMVAASVMVIFIALVLIGNRKAEKSNTDGLKNELRLAATEIFTPQFLIYTAIIIAYMLVIQPLHFLPSSFAFLLISMIYLKGSTPLKSLLISAATLGGIYLIFHYLFLVVLP